MTLVHQHPHSPALVTRVRDRALADPDAVAVSDETSQVSYGELMQRIDLMASALRAAGLEDGDRVALVAQNSAAFLISAFSVWEAGGVLATIYPSTAPADLAYTVNDAAPVLVLVDEATADQVVGTVASGIPVARIDTEVFVCDAVGANRDHLDQDPDLALICYSSGTTSRPKAIMLSHGALLHAASTYADVWHIDARDRVVVCLPMAWLFGLCTMAMTTLLAGGTVLSLRRASPALVASTVERLDATVLAGVTTIFTKLVQHLASAEQAVDISSLRFAVSGGEPRNEIAFARFQELVGIAVHDNYCSSECFPLVTYDPVVDPAPVPGAAGRLVPRAELKIIDADGTMVQPGDVGEGLAKGPGMMLGYWRDPEQTSQVITDDGWYRTKDLVRIDQAGYVHVVGRLSDMIIRGGSNVSPAEVERALALHPSVAESSVVGVPDAIYGQEVVAAVVLVAGAPLEVQSIRDVVGEELASFKVPTRIVEVSTLPRSATTGKIDRKQVAAALTEGTSS